MSDTLYLMDPPKGKVRVITTTVDADASGDGTGSFPKVTGKVHSIRYVKDDYDNTVDFTIIGATHGVSFWTESNVTANKEVFPHAQIHNGLGTGRSYTSDNNPINAPLVLINEGLSITVAQAGNATSGTFILTVLPLD